MCVIDLSRPVKSEKVRAGFQPHWRTVFIYKCERGHTVRVFANSFRGKTPVPGIGGIKCGQCECEDKFMTYLTEPDEALSA
jgi:hypothetical protein